MSFTILAAPVGCGDDKNPGASVPDLTVDTGGDTPGADSSSGGGQSDTGVVTPTTTTGINDGTTSTSTSTGATTGGPGTSGDSLPPPDTSSDPGTDFIVPTDMMSGNECDVFAQDCLEGFKCMPYASSGDTWDAAKCTPVDAMPKQVGDDCTADNFGLSGIDNCDLGLICWHIDDQSNGVCIDMCTGTAEAPTCPDPEQVCDISNDGVIIVCLNTCNPLVQDCPDGQICFWDGATEFICDFDASGDMGMYQDPCAYINVCDYGLFCSDQSLVPDCANPDGCCAPYCSLMDPQCPASTMCESWYAEGSAPPGQEDIGACVIPM